MIFHFAQLSDIHINHVSGDHHDVLGGQSAGWLTDIVAELNRQTELDFVLISGDLVDNALPSEFDQFSQIISQLTKPYFIIPGNHDRHPPDSGGDGDGMGLTRYQFAQRFNPQIAARPSDGQAQAGYWSIALNAQLQFIGLDSIRDADWGGVIDAPQLAWLEAELAEYYDKFVILMVHHPLHALTPLDNLERWRNFVCDNGAEVLALLDRHPQVKLVVTGHHHCTKADMLGARLHLACPAIGIYPCAYRTLRLTTPDSGGEKGECWQVAWQTHAATDETALALSHHMMITAWQEAGFDEATIAEHVEIARGNDFDREGAAVLD
jgi:3',5'-cyclic AMP phosphodiesterase CpdA